MKRGKAEEGEKVLAEAYAAKPAPSTMASIARVLADSARKAGNEALQLEYLTVLALSGRITAARPRTSRPLTAKPTTARWTASTRCSTSGTAASTSGFAVTPYVRTPPAKPTGRAVLAEVFPGAG